MKDEVLLRINSCENCPYMRAEIYYTASYPFNTNYQFWCSKSSRPKPEINTIEPHVPNSSRIAFNKAKRIPTWCPLREETRGVEDERLKLCYELKVGEWFKFDKDDEPYVVTYVRDDNTVFFRDKRGFSSDYTTLPQYIIKTKGP